MPDTAAREAATVRWRAALSTPVDISIIVYFRIGFGVIMAWEMWRYLDPHNGFIDRYYAGKEFTFSYWPFTFVQTLPEPWLHMAFWATGIAALMVAAGLFYRIAAAATFLGLAYIFLLDQAQYLNHFYLLVLIAFLMIWVPANRSFSIDARRKPEIRSDTAPAWALWLLRFQVAVPYFFGGIAKLNSDWLHGEPMRQWLAERTTFPLIGRLFTSEPTVWFMSYAALVFDLFVVYGLLNRKTRPWTYLAAVGFHLLNSRLFGIGVFPWIMIASTLVFFDADWPRRLIADLRGDRSDMPLRVKGFCVGALVGWLGAALLPHTLSPVKALIGFVAVGVLGYDFGALAEEARARRGEAAVGGAESIGKSHHPLEIPPAADRRPGEMSKVGFALLGAWVAVQVLMPLRHFVIPGEVSWTEEGHDFSWHMKLRDKDGDAAFFVNADGRETPVDLTDYLSGRQISKVSTQPEMIVEFAHFLRDTYKARGFDDVEVRAVVMVSLNGRKPQLLIDPNADLASEGKFWIGHADWILPLREPLTTN